jgi:hypothetical protein
VLKLTGLLSPSGWYRSQCGTTNPRITPHARRRSVRYLVPRLANPAHIATHGQQQNYVSIAPIEPRGEGGIYTERERAISPCTHCFALKASTCVCRPTSTAVPAAPVATPSLSERGTAQPPQEQQGLQSAVRGRSADVTPSRAPSLPF